MWPHCLERCLVCVQRSRGFGCQSVSEWARLFCMAAMCCVAVLQETMQINAPNQNRQAHALPGKRSCEQRTTVTHTHSTSELNRTAKQQQTTPQPACADESTICCVAVCVAHADFDQGEDTLRDNPGSTFFCVHILFWGLFHFSALLLQVHQA
jgi:hypothetical protein